MQDTAVIRDQGSIYEGAYLGTQHKAGLHGGLRQLIERPRVQGTPFTPLLSAIRAPKAAIGQKGPGCSAQDFL